MRRTVIAGVLAVVVGGGLAACGGGERSDTSNLKEIQKQRAGEYIVTLLNDTGQLKEGKNDFVFEVRAASDNQLVDVGAIQVGTSMPMPGMPNMVGEILAPGCLTWTVIESTSAFWFPCSRHAAAMAPAIKTGRRLYTISVRIYRTRNLIRDDCAASLVGNCGAIPVARPDRIDLALAHSRGPDLASLE